MRSLTLVFTLVALQIAAAQAPPTPSRPLLVPPSWTRNGISVADETKIDPEHVYSLPEMVNLAEQHNPDTRVAWEAARQRLSQLRIAESEWFPTLTAIAFANTTRQGILFNTEWVRQTIGLFQPFLRVTYTVFDFGERTQRDRGARSQLRAADFSFNATHLQIMFQTAQLYYRYLNALGQRDAAEVNLKDANTVEQAVDARLKNGLATLPDLLEARSAAAQADYELQAAEGQVQIAHGALLDELGASPAANLKVQPLKNLSMPGPLNEEADAAIDRALKQRPDLAQRVAQKQAAEAASASARRAYLPTLNFSGDAGEARAWGQQNLLPGVYAGPLEIWNTSLSLEWRVFDGGRREAELARAHAEQKRAQAEIEATRDEVEVQVWTAYVNLRTAYRQRDAAAVLLTASQSSYDAALESYRYGLRNTIDVLNAQRLLAQAISQDVAARTGLLIASAAFAYRTGDLLNSTGSQQP